MGNLILKGIPIVEDNKDMRKKLEGLPILWTKNFTEITENYLINKYNQFLDTKYDFSYLFLNFYGEKLQTEIFDRSKHWCFKRNLGDIFNKYYSDVSIASFKPNNIDVVDRTNRTITKTKINTGETFYALKDGNGEFLDRKLDQLFESKKAGVFIDVGAHDGVDQSNTLFLEKNRQWNGILITPKIDKYVQCVKNRPNSMCKQFACVEPSYDKKDIKGDFWKLSGSINGLRNKTDRLETVLVLLLQKFLILIQSNFMLNMVNSTY